MSTPNKVYFMIGCQRSGSNWLRTMLSEREDLIAPHPPHIMRDFMPQLGKFGDLALQDNLQILIDHVVAFVERNQVQWLDLHNRPMKFNRSRILMEVKVTMECFRFKELSAAKQEGSDSPEEIDNAYYLLAVFDTIMNTMAAANGKKIWMCKSMGMSQYHDMLLSFYGQERLRYIYLVRDPRDVCLSFMKTPVGDCHPYAITKKWVHLQNSAARILHETPNLFHQVCYEDVLGDRKSQVAKIMEFMGSRDVCRSMRRGSIIAIKDEDNMVSGAKKGREAVNVTKLSYQFKNLGRGESFLAGQLKKWEKEMEDHDLLIVESVAFHEMKRLGYIPHLIENEESRIEFTEKLCGEYTAENECLIEKMNRDLAVEDPDDLNRRQIQAAVLKKPTDEHYDEEFVKTSEISIDAVLESLDNGQEDVPFLKGDATACFDFKAWPLQASMVGLLPDSEVSKRLKVQDTQTLKVKGGLSITFAAASQGGYYPCDSNKANQDNFIAGLRGNHGKRSSYRNGKNDTAENSAVLFAVFDGHGHTGAECATLTRDYISREFEGWETEYSTQRGSLCEKVHFSSSMSNAYRQMSSLLESGEVGVDASHSGTTASTLIITDRYLHTAHVGDSRCLLIEQEKVKALTIDHDTDREDEIKRIELHGGVVMSSDQYDSDDANFPVLQQKRVWSKQGKWPGTAFTRSIGDAIAKQIGVCADAECAHFPNLSDSMFIIGSDGVFDFIPDDEIGKIVNKFHDPADACRELIGKSWNRWCESEERVDDITVIVGHVKRKSNITTCDEVCE